MVLLIIPGIIGMVVCLFLLLIKALTKKPKKKTVIAFVIFFAMCVVAISSIDDSGSEEPTPTTPPTIEATVAQEATEPATEPPAEPATEPPTEPGTMSKAETVDLVVAVLNASIGQGFDYHKIEGDETGITVSVAIDGLAQDVTLAKAMGYDASYQPWIEARNAMIGLCNTISDSCKTFGLDDILVTVITLNDANHDNTIMMVMNGVVIYDAMAD